MLMSLYGNTQLTIAALRHVVELQNQPLHHVALAADSATCLGQTLELTWRSNRGLLSRLEAMLKKH